MTNNLIKENTDVHFDLGCVDVKEINGQLWFCANDIAI